TTAAPTSTVTISNDSSAWVEQLLVFVTETAMLYAFTAPILSAEVSPAAQIAVMRCTRMGNDHIGKGTAGFSELLLTVHGANRRTWVLRAHDDATATSWMDTVNRICDRAYGSGDGGGIAMLSNIQTGVAMHHSKSQGTPSLTLSPNSGAMLQRVRSTTGNGRAQNSVASNGPMGTAEREARMRKDHQDYILKQQQLCEKRKLEVAMRKEMEIFERGISSVLGPTVPATYSVPQSNDEDLRVEASKLLKFLS
ncbi:hypothetical protein HDU82_004612, partial [Entophlyctis luteolus]